VLAGARLAWVAVAQFRPEARGSRGGTCLRRRHGRPAVLDRSAFGSRPRPETASLDLRFRLRGVKPAEPETIVVLVDDRSLEALGRWPLSRRLYAQAVEKLDRAGARVIAFDLLFAEPEEAISEELRSAARTAAGGLTETQDPNLRRALARLAEDDPDRDLAAALKASGKALLPVAFAFQGPAVDAVPLLSAEAYARFDQSEAAPFFPLPPVRR
jgi:CHASE2 domain-containing sensor protein